MYVYDIVYPVKSHQVYIELSCIYTGRKYRWLWLNTIISLWLNTIISYMYIMAKVYSFHIQHTFTELRRDKELRSHTFLSICIMCLFVSAAPTTTWGGRPVIHIALCTVVPPRRFPPSTRRALSQARSYITISLTVVVCPPSCPTWHVTKQPLADP